MANDEAEKHALRRARDFLERMARSPQPSLGVTIEDSLLASCVDALARTIGVRYAVSKGEIRKSMIAACRDSVGKSDPVQRKPKERARAAHEKLIAHLTQAVKTWLVAEPYDEVSTNARRVFGNVTFLRMPKTPAQILRVIKSAGIEQDRLTQEALEHLGRHATLAIVRVDAIDSAEAEARGRTRIEAALGAIHLCDPYGARDVARDRVVISHDLHGERLVFGMPTMLRSSHVKRARMATTPKAWRAIGSLLRLTKPSEMQERWLSALRWCMRASNAIDPNVAILQYVVALETAIGKKEHASAAEISYRAAWLHRDAATRGRFAAFVSTIYNDRNKIAHGGHADEANEHRAMAKRVLTETIGQLALRTNLAAMSTERFDQHWQAHRLS